MCEKLQKKEEKLYNFKIVCILCAHIDSQSEQEISYHEYYILHYYSHPVCFVHATAGLNVICVLYRVSRIPFG